MSEASGDSLPSPEDKVSNDDAVAYTTYKKVLTEKKNIQEKMRSLESQLNEINEGKKLQEQQKLESQGEYKKILENRETELAASRADNEALAIELTSTWKKTAFFNKLGTGLVDPVYEQHIPLDQIAINPETNSVDGESVDVAVNQFLEKHPHLVKRKEAAKLPGNAPNTNYAPKPIGSLTQSERSERLSGALTKLLSNPKG